MSCASGTATTSSSGSTLMNIPREPIKIIGELTGSSEGVPVVVSLGICIHKVLKVTSSLMKLTRVRIVLTWCVALLLVNFRVAALLERRIKSLAQVTWARRLSLRRGCVGFEPWRLVKMHSGQVSTCSSFNHPL